MYRKGKTPILNACEKSQETSTQQKQALLIKARAFIIIKQSHTKGNTASMATSLPPPPKQRVYLWATWLITKGSRFCKHVQALNKPLARAWASGSVCLEFHNKLQPHWHAPILISTPTSAAILITILGSARHHKPLMTPSLPHGQAQQIHIPFIQTMYIKATSVYAFWFWVLGKGKNRVLHIYRRPQVHKEQIQRKIWKLFVGIRTCAIHADPNKLFKDTDSDHKLINHTC